MPARSRAGIVALAILVSAVAKADVGDGVKFALHSVDDSVTTGEIDRIAPDGSVGLRGNKALPASRFISLRRASEPMPHFPHDRPHVLLVNGDRIPGLPIAIEGRRLLIAADLGVERELSVPTSSVAAIRWTAKAARQAATPEGRHDSETGRRHDEVRLKNGDVLRGSISLLERNGGMTLVQDGAPVSIARDRIDSATFSTELARQPGGRGPRSLLVLRNGARLTARSVSLADGELAASLLTGGEIRLPVAELAALDALGGPAVYLSDLNAVRFEFTPYLGIRWPLTVNRSVFGGDLRLAGGTFDRGIGVHSACVATYQLPANSRRFEALVGLDEASGKSGDVSIQVRLNGQSMLAEKMELRGGERAREIRLTLPPEARELTLAVDFGRGGDVQDHVNWVDARVIVRAP